MIRLPNAINTCWTPVDELPWDKNDSTTWTNPLKRCWRQRKLLEVDYLGVHEELPFVLKTESKASSRSVMNEFWPVSLVQSSPETMTVEGVASDDWNSTQDQDEMHCLVRRYASEAPNEIPTGNLSARGRSKTNELCSMSSSHNRRQRLCYTTSRCEPKERKEICSISFTGLLFDSLLSETMKMHSLVCERFTKAKKMD